MVADTNPWNGVFIEDDAQAGTVLRHVRIEGFGSTRDGRASDRSRPRRSP